MAALLAALVLALAACDDAAAPDADDEAAARPHVLLVTFDTTRADRIGAYGYALARTPVWDRLAAEGVLFERAVAPVPLTLPTHASLLTGVYPVEHGVHDNGGFELHPDAVSLAEAFRDAGYRTGAFVGSYVLDERFGLGQGFEVYTAPEVRGTTAALTERPAGRVVDDALRWRAGVRAGVPTFAWVHFYDPHFPYAPPAPFYRAFSQPYDGEIAYADEQLGRLLAGWGDEPSIVALTSDHGDALGEHGERTHGNFVYHSTLHVPLVLWGAALEQHAGRRVATPVSIVRLPATLAALAGLPSWPGRRLPSLLAADAPASAPDEPPDGIYFESYLPYYAHRWRAFRGVVWGDHKWVDANPPALFDLARDPGEEHDLAESEPELAAEGRRRLRALLDRHPPRPWSRVRSVSDEERARLEALGYVSAGAAERDDAQAPFAATLPDPRSRREDAALLQESRDLLAPVLARSPSQPMSPEEAERRLARAEELLAELLARNPDDLAAVEWMASLEIERGDCESALPRLERLLRTPRADDAVRFDRASCLGALGQRDEAAAIMDELLERNPGFLLPYRWLFKYHVQRGEHGLAAARLREGLAYVAPANVTSFLQLIEWAEGEARGADAPAPRGGFDEDRPGEADR